MEVRISLPCDWTCYWNILQDGEKTASQIARSTNVYRSLALLEQLVAAVRGPRKLLELWRAECVKLTNQRRSSTRLARMYEMLVVLAGQVGR